MPSGTVYLISIYIECIILQTGRNPSWFQRVRIDNADIVATDHFGDAGDVGGGEGIFHLEILLKKTIITGKDQTTFKGIRLRCNLINTIKMPCIS